MGKKSDDDNGEALPQRDGRPAKVAERMAQRRADDRADGFEVGNDPSRPSHPDGWQSGGR